MVWTQDEWARLDARPLMRSIIPSGIWCAPSNRMIGVIGSFVAAEDRAGQALPRQASS